MRPRAFVWAAFGLALVAPAGMPQGASGGEGEADRVAGLIRQLGHDDFAKRETASRALEAIGAPALDGLRQAADSSDDAEVRSRTARILEDVEGRLPVFFNRRDLTGWQGLEGCWGVCDGAVVGTTRPGGLGFNTFLCSKKRYRDFELTFQVRLVGDGWAGNSGVQVRSAVLEPERFTVKGPQCDIGAGYWGDLHGENCGGLIKAAPADVVKKVVKEGAFNDYFIRCVGKHVTIKVNGATTVDGEFADLPDEGVIAWQLHGGGPMEVTFRNIDFKELTRK
jgi:hypothetical protein